MSHTSLIKLKSLALQLPDKIPYLKMLVLFGSRATGKTHENSDWDFAVLCDEEKRQAYIQDNAWGWFEIPLILGESFAINPDKIDVIELHQCSKLIAHSIANDGKIIYEKEPGEFEKFRENALLSESEINNIYSNSQQNMALAYKARAKIVEN
jgi:uncharacterized protein